MQTERRCRGQDLCAGAVPPLSEALLSWLLARQSVYHLQQENLTAARRVSRGQSYNFITIYLHPSSVLHPNTTPAPVYRTHTNQTQAERRLHTASTVTDHHHSTEFTSSHHTTESGSVLTEWKSGHISRFSFSGQIIYIYMYVLFVCCSGTVEAPYLQITKQNISKKAIFQQNI